MNTFIKYSATTLLLLAFSAESIANLLINPTRVTIGDGERSADITLINTSSVRTTYRLEWSEKRAKEGGGYTSLSSEEAKSFPVASSMIRFSPRQVTLGPGERQSVKLAVRRPSNLKAGEYRSHLLFRSLPPATDPDSPPTDAASTAINIKLSFAIPIVVRQGAPEYSITIDSATIQYQPKIPDGAVEVTMSRSGQYSVAGDIEAYWTPNGGKQQLIAKTSEYSFWPELERTTASLAWVGTKFVPADGKLRITYTGIKDFRGKVFFDKTFDVKRSAIQMTQ